MYKLLIVDDEPQILEGMKCTLNWEKYGVGQIETALSYREAVDKAVKMNPDIALIDVCIGDKRGYDIINELNLLQLKTIYIMISGFNEFKYAQKAIRCGARDYLLKPVEREKLQPIVERIIVQDLHGTVENLSNCENEVDPVLGVRYDNLSNLTNRILVMVKAEYHQNINLKTIAEKFKMNSTYLGQIFLKETHMKFSEYLMVYRLQCSRDKILNTDEKISQIASSVGFSNPNYFYSCFHDYFNLSPMSFRQ
jgi:two-component system response regulator YesN